jgi:SAM-dependent methyltransferase
MRDVIQEIAAAREGRHPDPALLPPGFSDWQFARELNRQAYDRIADDYNEDYFENPRLAEEFEGWMQQLPAGGTVLDAGCGHGDPVISRLLERGFAVTGSDLSPKMLARAREQFPQTTFLERDTTELEAEDAFDGVCSFSSMVYLDPIDFFHSIYRVFRALKPGGLLFLYGYDLHPDYRGNPYRFTLDEWMWSHTIGLMEITSALEEHGYFKVLMAKDTTTEDERQEFIEGWRTHTMEEHEEFMAMLGGQIDSDPPDLSTPPDTLAYNYVVIAKKQAR